MNFESELDALLTANDEKKQQTVQAQTKARNESEEFVGSFKKVTTTVIRPALEQVKTQLNVRNRQCRIEEELDATARDGKEQRAAISIYFNISSDRYVPSLHEYPHVSFYCDKHEKVVQIHESTIGPNHGGSSGPAGSLKLNEVTDSIVKSKIMNVLRELYK
jgi:uncharacterized protein YjaZ